MYSLQQPLIATRQYGRKSAAFLLLMHVASIAARSLSVAVSRADVTLEALIDAMLTAVEAANGGRGEPRRCVALLNAALTPGSQDRADGGPPPAQPCRAVAEVFLDAFEVRGAYRRADDLEAFCLRAVRVGFEGLLAAPGGALDRTYVADAYCKQRLVQVGLAGDAREATTWYAARDAGGRWVRARDAMPCEHYVQFLMDIVRAEHDDVEAFHADTRLHRTGIHF
jgi:hypothetical protein